jgi:hypothetical protein
MDVERWILGKNTGIKIKDLDYQKFSEIGEEIGGICVLI